jgi:DNA-binding NarL/FixJ family response regulator
VIRVCIVENETLVREGLRRVLELDPELQVAGEARDGVEALELFAKTSIGGALGVAERTVKNHVSSILAKLLVRDRTRAVLKAISQRLI